MVRDDALELEDLAGVLTSRNLHDLIVASVCHKYSMCPSIRPICTVRSIHSTNSL